MEADGRQAIGVTRGRERSRRIVCDTCEPLVTGKSVRRVYRFIGLISSSANDYIKCVFAVAVVLTWSIFPAGPVSHVPTMAIASGFYVLLGCFYG